MAPTRRTAPSRGARPRRERKPARGESGRSALWGKPLYKESPLAAAKGMFHSFSVLLSSSRWMPSSV